jgi:hypothetical protein
VTSCTRSRRFLALRAAAAVVLASASAAHAGIVTWTQVPLENDPTPASYNDAINWSDATGIPVVPGSGDVAVFDAADVYEPSILLPSSVTHAQLKVLHSWPLIAATSYDATNPTRITLTGADNRALQVGPATSNYAGWGFLTLRDLHVEIPNGGLTVSGADGPDGARGDADLDLDRTSLTVKKDFVLGANGGYGFSYLFGGATARIGGDVLVGADGVSDGQLEVYNGYKMEVGGNLKVGDGYLTVQGPDVPAQTTGITVAGDVHIGPHASRTGEGGMIFLVNGTYLHAGGDMILHAADDQLTASIFWGAEDSRGSAQNLLVEKEGAFQVSGGGQFEVRGNATVKPGGFVYVGPDSALTVKGLLSVEAGGEADILGTLTGNLVSHGATYLSSTAGRATAFNQADDGELLVKIASNTEFGHLTVDGTAALDGLLSLTFGFGYVPAEGATFDILDAGQILGTFDRVAVDSTGWYAAFDPSTGMVTLTQQVPEPTALLAALPLALLRRRRRSAATDL